MLACVLLLAFACKDPEPSPGEADAGRNDSPDAAGTRDADIGATDAEPESDAEAEVDAGAEIDPTDTAQAQATLERVFASMGLNPRSRADIRRVWEESDLFEAYLAAWEADRGVVFERQPMSKAECLSLGRFDPSVPYCGPGCNNNQTVAPPCLNRGCFEHDACYAANECRTGELIDVGLSFSALTACCDAPLAPARDACGPEVARGFLLGEISLAEAELYSAVASIMVAVEASELLDSETNRPPATCDETYEQACAPGELDVNAMPAEVEASGSVEVCATLTRSGRPVGRWLAVPQDPPFGQWSAAEVAGSGEAPVCITWTAPAEFGEFEGPIDLVINAAVLGETIAADSVAVELISGPCGEGFARIEAGAFTMGSPHFVQESTCSIEMQRPVTLSQDFCMQVTEVTQGQWLAAMGSNPSAFSVCGENCPVENVTWYDALFYANTVSLGMGLDPCYEMAGCTERPGSECDAVASAGPACNGYRLPEEAEWEFAARAGDNAEIYGPLDEVAWHEGNAGGMTHPVATRAPNAWGLYDVYGNVAEFTSATVEDPLGPLQRFLGCVYRSSSWFQPAEYARASNRICIPCRGGRNGHIGLRLVRSLP